MRFDQRMEWPYNVDHGTGTSWNDPRLNPKFKDFDGFGQHMNAPKVYEIPVHHGNSKEQHSQTLVQAPRVPTPPQVGATPKAETSRGYTLPRNHENRNSRNQQVREIPIQHVYSRIPSKQGSLQPECPQPDYPGAPSHLQQHPQGQAADCAHPHQQSCRITQPLGYCKQSSHAPHPENEVVFNIPTIRESAKVCPEPQNFQLAQSAESARLEDDQTNDMFNQNNINMNSTCSGLDQTENIETDDLKEEDHNINEDRTIDQEQQRNISMQMITDTLTECQTYKEKVSSFNGTKNDKEYKFLEEMLTRCILKLDNIYSGFDLNVRNARKSAVHEIQSNLDQLEKKALNAEVVPCQLHANALEMNQELLDTSSQLECEESENKDTASIKEMVVDE